ncbi:hypothetical protein QFZ87_001204 [Bacillus sp. SLBN-46]|uniref:hypothetical protein n=1 Tax=Bacillus sp. SLBN-46 TaxID=3042283 RepID=UPI0028679978|nr:hypothetical protein [Bacillus sp. SLBN-46]MDR6121607.1 hypothetical protein [Bacillus sp. SLBN-46]
MLKHIKRYLITYIIVQFVMNMVHPGIIFATTDGTPLVNIDSPSLQGKTVTVSGTVEGAPQNAELIIKGDNFTSETITVDYDTGNWSYQFPDEFSSGEYHYTILATVDSQSTPSTTNLDFTVDATGPIIGINSSRFQNNNVIITGTVIDNTPSNVITMEIYDNSIPSNPTKINDVDIINPTPTNNQWTFSFPTEFVEGPYYYKIRATDSLGNFSEKSYTFYVGELPKVSSVKVNYADIDLITGDRITPTIELLNSEYMNHVTTNTKVTVSITDNMITTDTIRNSIVVLNSEGGKVDGVISPPQKIGNEIQVEFFPNFIITSEHNILYIN